MVDLFQVNGSEASVAKAALFSRHPEMIDWPADHNWFFAKMNITQVWVLDYFGGVKTITPEEYYRATPYQKHNDAVREGRHLVEVSVESSVSFSLKIENQLRSTFQMNPVFDLWPPEYNTKRGKGDQDSVYQPISKTQSPYDVLRGAEEGPARGGRRRGDDTYTPLQKKSDDTYREIEAKPGQRRRADQVYQGLSSATKDTYDALHMQQIHPPPR
ncbi:hypothetical protein cypCar_00043133 [Cyprinus carpio]|nr:hypothetical protein cypCar_00043133 [Cyprinus carpio]